MGAAFVLTACAGQAYAGYTFTDLGALTLGSSQANAINNVGQVAGFASYDGNPVIWTGTTVTNLGTLGRTGGIGNDINNVGQVAGISIFGGYGTNLQGAVWISATGTGVILDSLGGSIYNYAQSINDAGEVVGWQQTPSGTLRAIRWDGTTATDLGTLGGANSAAYSINKTGQIAGFASTLGDAAVHATVWNGTTTTDLGTLGGSRSEARAINDAGHVVGYSYLAGDVVGHATLWNGTTITDLGTLGGNNSYGYAINNAGQVVGVSSVIGDLYPHATLWNGTTAIDLNSLLDASYLSAGWVLTSANDINDSGWIVGNAYSSVRQEYHGFMLSMAPVAAVPEPATYTMMLAGLGLMGAISRRRKEKNSAI